MIADPKRIAGKRKKKKTRGQVVIDNKKLSAYCHELQHLLGELNEVSTDAVDDMGGLIVPAFQKQVAALKYVREQTEPFKESP